MRVSSSKLTSDQAWARISRKFEPMRTLIYSGMLRKWESEIEALQARRCRMAHGQYLRALADLEGNYTEELGERLFVGCCELWNQQGLAESENFFQSMWNFCLTPLFKERRRMVISRLKRATPSGFVKPDFANAVERFDRRIAVVRTTLKLKAEASDSQFDATKFVHPVTHVIYVRRPDRRSRPISSTEKKKRAIVIEAAKARLTGPHYCRELARKGIKTPDTWQREGCPAGYVEAYRAGEPWKHRIQDEKSRITRG